MSSTYTSFIPPYSETSILDRVAQLAEQLGQQQYGWAQQQFASNSALTDQVVNNYLTASQLSMSNAQNMTDRYNTVFQPQEDALVRDANTYASDTRVRSEMGRAESDAGQAMDADRRNLERKLQSYGINPSDGRYAELEHAQDAQRAATQAQAGQAARYNTENVGRDLRNRAIAVGQQYPGQVVNALNNAMQGYAGAENAKLSNTNTGVNAFDSANRYLGTAMALKYPPLGQQGSRSGGGIMTTTAQNGSSSGRSGGGGGGPSNPFGGGGGGLNLSSGRQGGGGGGGGYAGGDNGSGSYKGPSTFAGGSFAKFVPGGEDAGGENEDFYNGMDYTGGESNMAWGQDYNQYDPSNYDFSGAGGDTGGWGDFNGDWGTADQGWGNTFDNYDYQASNFDQGYDSYGIGDTYDYGNYDSYNTAGQYDLSDPGYSSYDSGGWDSYDSGGGDYGLDYSSGDWGDYAAGGAIPDNGPTTGGFVPPQASPSGGAQTDDVNAHVNVGEFVVPRDVALWKGQEFFQNLIKKSREARAGAPAKGKPSNRPTGGSPSFVSQAAR